MDLTSALLSVGGSAGALTAIGLAARSAWRTTRRIVCIAEAVQELSPTGSSIKDTVDRMDGCLNRMDSRLTILSVRFEDHLAICPKEEP